MRLRRPTSPPRLIALVSMVDVLLIMLVFFMVTSTYLDLDMIPVAKSVSDGTTAQPPAALTPVMIRLAADGRPFLQGQPHGYDTLSGKLAAMPPETPVLILPSLHADTQSLVTLMDVATTAGISTLSIVQVDAP